MIIDSNMKRSRNGTIDVFRMIAAIFIVALHSQPLCDITEAGDFFLTHILCRIAVPFFIVCSGYFLSAKSIGQSDQAVRRIVFRELKKLVTIYVIFSLIYLIVYIPNWISTGWFSPHAFVDWFIAALRNGSYYHLWYILAMIYLMVILLAVFPILLKNRVLRWVAIFLLGTVEVLEYAYRQFLPTSLSSLFGICDKFGCAFYAVVRCLPFFLLGTCLYESKSSGQLQKPQYGLSISAVLLVAEVYFLKHIGGTQFSYVFMTLPTAYFLFGTLLNLKVNIDSKGQYTFLLSRMSFIIYCVHPAVLQIVDMFKPHSLVRFLFTAGVSVVIAVMYCFLSQKKKENCRNY